MPLIRSVPETADGVLLIRPDAIRKCPSLQKHFQKYVEKTAVLPEVCLIVLHGEDTLLLLPATPEQTEAFDHARGDNPYLVNWNRDLLPQMKFQIHLSGTKEAVALGCIRSACFVLSEEAAVKELQKCSPNGIPDFLLPEEPLFSKDVLVSGVFRKNGSGVGAVPGLPDASGLVFCVRYEPFLPRPVSGELSFDGADAASAKRIYDGVKSHVAGVYQTAAGQGQIRPDLQQAFQVYSLGTRTRVVFQLTESLGRDFFELLHQALSGSRLEKRIILVK